MKEISNKLQIVLFFILLVVLIFIGWLGWNLISNQSSGFLSPIGKIDQDIKEKPLDKDSFENLRKRGGIASKIVLEELLESTADYDVYLFSYKSDGHKIIGLAHIPKLIEKAPVIIQSRGYVDINEYETGVGTRPSAQVYASNGFITLAPDFLGYGGSDMPPSNNVWEERFVRPVAVMDLLASIKTLPQADPEKIFLWGHSNGGMISMAVLEMTGKDYPTVVWAPVSRYFPYDVLYFTNEAEDKGKQLRKLLAEFEKDYDTDKYSFDEYLSWIKAPIQLHQGTADAYIPVSWSDSLAKKLKDLGLTVNYYLYPGADHQLRSSWDTVVERDVQFFKSFLQ
ncbi:alpha/beta fold hydrolase [Candidatus Microgenomates bacterium]|nr:alpha/beta fold hydrolase [Candidatus Microgenomates bacterium]